ncbi:MAG: Ni/Fe-hydrogenase cytochrome b subunit [Candidatus Eisenbacteria bacterium]|nr:Ni/Fe-hydrogenase cytochrome b subunit [Candidatus Latescibacterota bacterium]MBD3302412.1 Ni/Fe-hydrogenase cytochrome b subunit [Candidatus Eisenbacteria bacterium]
MSAEGGVKRYLTPGWLIVWIILIGGAVITFRRFAIGLGATTNLSDGAPWGLWIGFDVFSGVALAAGGFTMAFLVHLAGEKSLKPLVRPAILTALIGYVLVIFGLLYDLGKPWNIWHAMFWINHHSVMFEVAWCVMLYTTVLFLEFIPVVFERFRASRALKVMRVVAVPLYILGVILSTLHQSSLGSMMLIVPTKLHPLWYTPILPLLFFLSALTVGIAMVMTEAFISSKLLRRGLEFDLLMRLGRYLAVLNLFYLVVKFQDLVRRGAWEYVFEGSRESIYFIVEMLLFILPLFILFNHRLRRRRGFLFTSSLMVVLGLILNRVNVSFSGLLGSTSTRYFPDIQEIWISVFLVTLAGLVFGLAARYLPIFTHEEEEGEPEPEPARGVGPRTARSEGSA